MESYSEKLLLQLGDKHGTMFVRVWKPDVSAGTVFCIHGFEGNGSDFAYLANFLFQKGYTVVSPDIVGRGKSTYFGDPAAYSYGTYFTCIGALSKYAGAKNHFIGSSWGGALVMYFLCSSGVKADKVILNDVCMRGGSALNEAIKWIAADSQQSFDTAEDAYAYVRKSRHYLGTFSEDLWPVYLENKIRLSEGKFRLTYDPAITALIPAMAGREFDLSTLLEKIPAEILLLYGVESRCYEPELVAGLTRRFPNISCVPDLRSGHPPSLMTYDQALIVGGFLSG